MIKNNKKKLPFREKYGPYALVAGGSSGLGEAFAEALAERGLNLVLIARRKEELNSTADRLRERYSVDVKTAPANMADFENIKNIIAELNVSVGLLVYNAAFSPIGAFENTSEEHLALAAAVNVKTPLLLAKLLAAPMIQNSRGGIVLMSSLAGGQGCPKLAAYTATKAFNTVLAEGLWKEFRPYGIDVIGCCAGAILTPGYKQAAKSKAAPGSMEAREVAEQTLKALGTGPVVIPGKINKIARFLMTRLLSRKAAINMMEKNTGGLS